MIEETDKTRHEYFNSLIGSEQEVLLKTKSNPAYIKATREVMFP